MRHGADGGYVSVIHIALGNGQPCDIADKVGARIIPVEQIEELDKRINLPSLVNVDGATYAHIGLDVRRSPEFVKAGDDSVDGNAAAAVLCGDGERAGAFSLREGGQFETTRDVQRSS